MRFAVTLIFCAVAFPLLADEGMWPYNQFPVDTINQKHKFEVTPQFLENLRLASVKIPGGSGAFVSPNGLIITNQHLVAACIANVKDGSYAAEQTAEKPCPGLDASVLLKIDDVTSAVKAATKENTPAAHALEQRNAAIARIEKECGAQTGDVCSVVKLFSGGRYDLYHYKRYTDLRLVFAPELQLALFGRERDSVTYLRYGLDIAFLHAYENGKPAATPHYLKWSAEGMKEGDLIFAAGNPVATARVATAAQLMFYRDTSLPLMLRRLQPSIRVLSASTAPGAESTLAELLNTYKLAAGKLIGLRDDRLIARKTTFEGKVRRAVEHDPKLGTASGKVWDEVAAAYKNWVPFERPYQVLEGSPAPGSTLFRIARELVRGEYTRFNEIPIDPALELTLLTQYLDELKNLGDKEAPIKAIFGSKTSQQAAEEFVKSSKLQDREERKRLAANPEAARKSDDGMLRLAAILDPAARKLHKKHEEMIESLEASAAEKIAQYRFRLFGASDYPDATGTPRVEFGVVKAYIDRAGIEAPYAATFSGLYYRRNNEGPYLVPQRWVDLMSSLNLVTPLDFVSTCDIGGGDYGSPVVNKSGELVGVTFDGNLESLPDIYLYSDEKTRAVHVAVQGIAEALDKVYKAAPLLKELGVHSAPTAPPPTAP